MDNPLIELWQQFYSHYGYGIFVVIALVGGGGVIAQWALYSKCGQPGVACIVPVWNVVVFLKILGRPAWQSLILMIPPLVFLGIFMWMPLSILSINITALLLIIWIYFIVLIYIELCNSFGKNRIIDYLLCLLLNGLYVLNLGLSNEENYIGPVHAPKKHS